MKISRWFASRWSDLDISVLELVLQCLDVSSLAAFRASCVTWLAAFRSETKVFQARRPIKPHRLGILLTRLPALSCLKLDCIETLPDAASIVLDFSRISALEINMNLWSRADLFFHESANLINLQKLRFDLHDYKLELYSDEITQKSF